MRKVDIEVTFADKEASIKWADEMDEILPPWEDPTVKPSWASFEQQQVKKQRPAEKPARKPVTIYDIRKETTHPYLFPLGNYLAMKLGEEGMRKLLRDERVRTPEELEKRYLAQVMRQPGIAKSPGPQVKKFFNVEMLEEGALQRLIRGWESGPEIVSVGKDSKAKVFVKMLAMGPLSSHIIHPITTKEQPSQDAGSVPLKGVDKKVNIHGNFLQPFKTMFSGARAIFCSQ